MLADTAQSPEQIRTAESEFAKNEGRPSANLYLANATLAEKRGDAAAAETALNRALELDPKSAAAHLAMANLRVAQKDQSRAGAAFKAAAELSPPRSIARLKYAEFLVQSGARDEGRKALVTLTGQVPDYLPAWCLLAQLTLAEKKIPREGARAARQRLSPGRDEF